MIERSSMLSRPPHRKRSKVRPGALPERVEMRYADLAQPGAGIRLASLRFFIQVCSAMEQLLKSATGYRWNQFGPP